MTADMQRTISEALHRTLTRLSAGRSPLDQVEDMPIIEDFVADFVAARIADARAAGVTWADVARILGVSRRAAHKRFTASRGWRRRGPIIELRFTRDEE